MTVGRAAELDEVRGHHRVVVSRGHSSQRLIRVLALVPAALTLAEVLGQEGLYQRVTLSAPDDGPQRRLDIQATRLLPWTLAISGLDEGGMSYREIDG